MVKLDWCYSLVCSTGKNLRLYFTSLPSIFFYSFDGYLLSPNHVPNAMLGQTSLSQAWCLSLQRSFCLFWKAAKSVSSYDNNKNSSALFRALCLQHFSKDFTDSISLTSLTTLWAGAPPLVSLFFKWGNRGTGYKLPGHGHTERIWQNQCLTPNIFCLSWVCCC